VKSIQIIESHKLSTGDTARITKLGREYQFAILYQGETPPENTFRLNKEQAYKMLADELGNDNIEEGDS
jgi:hypothetical protein